MPPCTQMHECQRAAGLAVVAGAIESTVDDMQQCRWRRYYRKPGLQLKRELPANAAQMEFPAAYANLKTRGTGLTTGCFYLLNADAGNGMSRLSISGRLAISQAVKNTSWARLAIRSNSILSTVSVGR